MSTNQTRPNKAKALAEVQALVAGTSKHFPNATFTFGNASYTTASLTQILQNLENALVAANGAQTGARDAVSALRGVQATAAPVIRDYKRYVASVFGNATQTLADFGLQAPKARTSITGEARVSATAKMRATRAARGTTSKKQKLAVKGNVTGVVVTPVTSAPVSAAPSEATPPASPPAAPSPAAASVASK